MCENELLNLDELDAVAGGAKSANDVEVDGQVTELFPYDMYQVQLDNGNSVRCSILGKLRIYHIHIAPGDRVRVSMQSNGSSQGRIVYRY